MTTEDQLTEISRQNVAINAPLMIVVMSIVLEGIPSQVTHAMQELAASSATTNVEKCFHFVIFRALLVSLPKI